VVVGVTATGTRSHLYRSSALPSGRAISPHAIVRLTRRSSPTHGDRLVDQPGEVVVLTKSERGTHRQRSLDSPEEVDGPGASTPGSHSDREIDLRNLLVYKTRL